MKKIARIFFDWIRKIFTPKSKFSAALTITLVASLVLFCYMLEIRAKSPYKHKKTFENPIELSSRIVNAQLDFGAGFFSGKKAVIVKISRQAFNEKKFQTVYMEQSSGYLELYFWGIDDRGIFYFFKFPVSQKTEADIKIAGASLSGDGKEIEVSYAIDGEALTLWLWLIFMLVMALIMSFTFRVSDLTSKSQRELGEKLKKMKEEAEKVKKMTSSLLEKVQADCDKDQPENRRPLI